MSKAIFITGTGTDIGKTVLSLAVLVWAQSRNLRAAYFKPVQCGAFPFGNPPVPCDDAGWIKTLLPENREPQLGATVNVAYRFQNPVSPHLAAEKENRSIDLATLRHQLIGLMERHDLVLMEGAGGAAVPLDRKGLTLAHLAAELRTHCLLACAPGLGTLHHTLATLAFLEKISAPPLGFVFCRAAKDDALSPRTVPDLVEDNVRTLESLTGLPCFGILPHLTSLQVAKRLDPAEARRLFDPISDAMNKWWNACSSKAGSA